MRLDVFFHRRSRAEPGATRAPRSSAHGVMVTKRRGHDEEARRNAKKAEFIDKRLPETRTWGDSNCSFRVRRVVLVSSIACPNARPHASNGSRVGFLAPSAIPTLSSELNLDDGTDSGPPQSQSEPAPTTWTLLHGDHHISVATVSSASTLLRKSNATPTRVATC